jgi:ElaB/YqjD/DUF883 family membrane-anchored ribosome-binding protein
MGQTADQLRQEIAAKRDDAAAKIDQIESRVQDLPNLARETVRGTVDASIQQARDTVDEQLSHAREAVVGKVDQMKQQTSMTTVIDERPLAALGVALAGGFLLGKLFGGEPKSAKGHDDEDRYRTDWSKAHSSSRHDDGHESHDGVAAGMGIAAAGGAGYAAGSSGLGSQHYTGERRQQRQEPGAISNALRQAAQQAGLDQTLSSLTTALVATLADQFNRTIEEAFPEFARHLKAQGGLGASGNAGSSGGGMGSGGVGSGASGGSSGFGSSSGSSRAGMSGASSGAAYGQDVEVGATDITGSPTPYYGDRSSSAGSGATTP